MDLEMGRGVQKTQQRQARWPRRKGMMKEWKAPQRSLERERSQISGVFILFLCVCVAVCTFNTANQPGEFISRDIFCSWSQMFLDRRPIPLESVQQGARKTPRRRTKTNTLSPSSHGPASQSYRFRPGNAHQEPQESPGAGTDGWDYVPSSHPEAIGYCDVGFSDFMKYDYMINPFTQILNTPLETMV